MGEAVMLIYLDTCSLQRPLDTKSQPRILLEAEAILAVVELCESGQIQLATSEALELETERNPHPTRRRYASEVLARARTRIERSDRLIERARQLNASGLSPLDALHLASAIEGRADYFCTCDDKLLRRAQDLVKPPPKIVSPLTLIEELEQP